MILTLDLLYICIYCGYLMLCKLFVMYSSAMIKKPSLLLHTVNNNTGSSPKPAGNPVNSLIKIFLSGITFGISVFPGIFRSWSRKNISKTEAFPAGKSLISDITWFPDGDRNYSPIFLQCIYNNESLKYR